MTSIEQAQDIARQSASSLKHELSIDKIPDVAVILGTGWGESLKLDNVAEVPFCSIDGFPNDSLQEINGHVQRAVYGDLAGKKVIALRGRIHLNEHSTDPNVPMMARLQAQMLLELGVRKFILTNAAGSLKHECRVGEIVVADGFVTLFAPDMPLFAGEFCSPEDKLSGRMRGIALESRIVDERGALLCHSGGYVMVRGPYFEGRRYDKAFLRLTGASAVGMSTLPEMCIIALYPEAEALCLSLITNTDSEEHSHALNQERAKEASVLLGAYLERIIRQI